MKVVISFIVSLIYLLNYFNYESVTKSKSYYINEIDIKDGDIKMDKKYYNI